MKKTFLTLLLIFSFVISACSGGTSASIVDEETFRQVTEEAGFTVDDISEMLQGLEAETALAASEGAGKHFQYFVIEDEESAKFLYNQLKSSLSMTGFTEDQVLRDTETSHVVQKEDLYARVDRSGNKILFGVSQPAELEAFESLLEKLGITP